MRLLDSDAWAAPGDDCNFIFVLDALNAAGARLRRLEAKVDKETVLELREARAAIRAAINELIRD